MKYIISLIIILIFLNSHSYEWIEIGNFDEPVWKYYNDENNDFQAVGVEEGLYLNTDENWEYYHRGFRVFDIADLDSTNLLLADASGACLSAGLWKFDIETCDYSVIMWAWSVKSIIVCKFPRLIVTMPLLIP